MHFVKNLHGENLKLCLKIHENIFDSKHIKNIMYIFSEFFFSFYLNFYVRTSNMKSHVCIYMYQNKVGKDLEEKKITHLQRSLHGEHFGMKFISVPLRRAKQMRNTCICIFERYLFCIKKRQTLAFSRRHIYCFTLKRKLIHDSENAKPIDHYRDQTWFSMH